MQNPHPRSANFEQEFGDRWVQQFNQDYQTWFYVDKNTGQSSWTQYVGVLVSSSSSLRADDRPLSVLARPRPRPRNEPPSSLYSAPPT